MRRSPDFQTIEINLTSELNEIAKSMQKYIEIVKNNPDDIDAQILELKVFRSNSYESLNQIQHEWLLVKALKWLSTTHHMQLEDNKYLIEWNPRQTGNGDEPDIRIINKEKNFEINCEATTSKNPVGVIDSRINKHLQCLSKLTGLKYYFVMTNKMKQRAETKIYNNGWDIEVIKL